MLLNLKNLSSIEYMSDQKRSERGLGAWETDSASPEGRKALSKSD